MLHEIPELDAKGLRHFALTTGGIVAILFGLLFPWLLNLGLPLWPWLLAGVLGIWGLIAPRTLRPVYRGWMRFGQLASRITTPIILGIVFYGVVMPMGLVMRLVGHDPMRRKLDTDDDSYRVRSTPAPRDSVERPY
jgi:hypothetical protein